jgi:hypothetical protein
MAVAEKFRLKADALRLDVQATVRRIKSDDTLHPTYVYTAVAEANADGKKKMAELKTQSDAFNAKYVQAAGQAAWGATAGETLSYRSALTGLEGKNPRDLQRTMSQAVETGDRTLAKACAYKAHTTPGADQVMQDYRNAYPDVAPALDNLAKAQSDNGGVLGNDVAHMFAFAMPDF